MQFFRVSQEAIVFIILLFSYCWFSLHKCLWHLRMYESHFKVNSTFYFISGLGKGGATVSRCKETATKAIKLLIGKSHTLPTPRLSNILLVRLFNITYLWCQIENFSTTTIIEFYELIFGKREVLNCMNQTKLLKSY